MKIIIPFLKSLFAKKIATACDHRFDADKVQDLNNDVEQLECIRCHKKYHQILEVSDVFLRFNHLPDENLYNLIKTKFKKP